MKNILEFASFRLSLMTVLASFFFSTILLSISAQAASAVEVTTGMERTWVIDLIIMKLEGFKWSGLN